MCGSSITLTLLQIPLNFKILSLLSTWAAVFQPRYVLAFISHLKKNANCIDQYIALGMYSIRNLLCACMKNLEPPKSETLGHVLLTIN